MTLGLAGQMLAAILSAAVATSPAWRPGALRGVVTGQRSMQMAKRVFGPPTNNVIDGEDPSRRIVTFPPISLTARRGGSEVEVRLGVELTLERRTGRTLRVLLTPMDRLERSEVALLFPGPFEERRFEFCPCDGCESAYLHPDAEGQFLELLAPSRGVVAHLAPEGDVVLNIEVLSEPPHELLPDPCTDDP